MRNRLDYQCSPIGIIVDRKSLCQAIFVDGANEALLVAGMKLGLPKSDSTTNVFDDAPLLCGDMKGLGDKPLPFSR